MVLSPSIEAVTDSGPSDTQFAPTIAKREVSTTVTVADGKTIIIAGLTREDKTKVVKKVPVLGSLPLVGFLFRSTSDATEKTDLLIYVTPRVVTAMAAAESVMKDWEQKTGLKTHEEK
jgi:type II secretory pathway component GspD/PulD (secretin)